MKTNVLSTVWKCYVRDKGTEVKHEWREGGQSMFLKSNILDLSEGRLLSVMSSFAEDVVPSVIEIDAHWNTFVMADVGQVEMYDIDMSLVLKGLGRLQKSSIAYVDQLREAGLLEYNCSWVKQNAKGLLEDSRQMLQEQDEGGTSSQNIDAGDIIRCAEELELFDMPLTLVHGDFHIGNIGSKVAEGHKIFDWGSAFIGHPLADVAVIVRTSGYSGDEETAVQECLPLWKSMCNIPDEATFRSAIGRAFLYYWIVNLASLLREREALPMTDHWFVKD